LIKANDDELTLVFGLMLNPVMIPDFTDFKEEDLNRIPFTLIKYMREADLDKLISSGCGLIPILNLKRRKIITDKECEELITLYGEYPTAQGYVMEVYNHLKSEAKKRLLSAKLESLDLQDETTEELYEDLTQALKLVDKTEVDNIETMKDVLPRSDKAQKSLVQFNHQWMQKEVAIDENYLVIVGARPGVGKTTFAVKLAMENSKSDKVLIYSLELTKEQMTRKAKYYGDYYHHSNVYIKQQTSLDIMQIRKDVKQLRPKFVIIDQLNKVQGEGKTELDKLTDAVRRLKIIAGDVKTPMIVLHQINRSGVDVTRPMIQHLKGSGAVEEEADIILLLDVKEQNITTVYCDKNRSLNGDCKKYDFSFDKSTNLYKEL
jgi:replicative DNA helicase